MLRHVVIGGLVGGAAGLGLWALLRRQEEPPGTTPQGPICIDNCAPTPPPEPGQPPVEPAPRACPSSSRVLLIGDSLVGDAPSNGLQYRMAQLAAACGTPFRAKGVVGSHVTQWESDGWLLPQLEAAQPTVVLLSMGTNDFKRTDPANVQSGVHNLAAKVRAHGARLLWIDPPYMPINDAIGVRAMWKAEVGSDWFNSELLTIPRGGDGIHPTVAGYKQFAEAIWPWMATLVG